MKITKEMPTTGQFIRVWMFEGVTWSSTQRWCEDGGLQEYNPSQNCWDDDDVMYWCNSTDIFFIV